MRKISDPLVCKTNILDAGPCMLAMKFATAVVSTRIRQTEKHLLGSCRVRCSTIPKTKEKTTIKLEYFYNLFQYKQVFPYTKKNLIR